MPHSAGKSQPLIEHVTGAAADQYRPLLSGYHRPLLSRLNRTADGPFIAIGARIADQPCGLLLCRVMPSRQIATVDAVQILPVADPSLLLPPMFAEAEHALAGLDCGQLRIDLETKSEMARFLPDALWSRDYQVHDFWCMAADLSAVGHAPWSRELKIPAEYDVVGWNELTDAERHQILSRQSEEPGFDDLPILPSSSFAVLREGRMGGWALTHRLSAKFVRLLAVHVSPNGLKTGSMFELIAESIRRQLATAGRPRGWYVEISMRDEHFIDMLQRRLLPCAKRYTILHRRKYLKELGHAATEHKPSSEPQDEIMLWKHVYSQRSPFQTIAIKRDHRGFYLELDGQTQFHSSEEYRYHEALVHPPMLVCGRPRRVLILGGGDGLALREVLRYDSVESVLLVDIDEAVTGLSRRFPPLAELNQHAFEDPRVEVLHLDALDWVQREPRDEFDVVLIDFPDPNSDELARLYALEFFERLKQHMGPRATLSIQSSSISRWLKTFWCTARTVEAAGFSIVPYNVELPIFGMWGFVCAALEPFEWPREVPMPLRFLDNAALSALTAIGRDRASPDVNINVEGDLQLTRYHSEEAASRYRDADSV